MQRKSIFIFGFIILILTSGFLALRSTAVPIKEESTCCKKKNNAACAETPKRADDMLPENLSHQFIMITPAY
jgi:hypothetical protein